jgi:sarcosine oxidase subunit beta
MHFTPEDGGLPQELPLTVDFATGFYFHREGEGLVFGGREPTIEGVASHGTRRLPVLADLPIQSSWWGWYEMSPDHNAIVGEAPLPHRFLYATGFSGHGFQMAPAVGEIVRDLYLRREPDIDVTALGADRPGRPERNVV